jgi:hypothetical protein
MMSTEHGGSPFPQFEDRKRMWLDLQVDSQATSAAEEEYAAALKRVYTNGSVRIATFLVHEDETFDWYLSRNLLHEMGFFEKFWRVGTVTSFMPEALRDLNFYELDRPFRHSSPFLLGGSLAWALAQGGAYEKHGKGPVHAKQLGDRLAADWISDRYDETLLYESHRAWSEFFMDVAWDHSWIVVDKQKRLVHVLCATDTD